MTIDPRDATPIELSTARLILREIQPSDLAAFHRFESDPSVVRWLLHEPRTEEQSRAYVERAIAEASESPRVTYELALTRREASEELLGRVALYLSKPELGEAAIWYVLHPSAQGHGFATEAMRAMVRFGFETLKLHRIWADIDPRNEASRRVVAKLGFRQEAHHLEDQFIKGEWCDTEIHAMLAHEWKRNEERGSFRAPR